MRENYAWRHHYWYLTNEGIQYLRDFLHLPPEIVPATLKRQTKPDAGARARPSKRKNLWIILNIIMSDAIRHIAVVCIDKLDHRSIYGKDFAENRCI